VIVIIVVLGAKLHTTEKRTKKVLLNPRSMTLKRRLKLTKIDESESEKPIVCYMVKYTKIGSRQQKKKKNKTNKQTNKKTKHAIIKVEALV